MKLQFLASAANTNAAVSNGFPVLLVKPEFLHTAAMFSLERGAGSLCFPRSGIAGPVCMDANGDREQDFSIMAMTRPEAGSYEVRKQSRHQVLPEPEVRV